MLAQTYDPARDDPSGWYMSEKLDGIRCYWDGETMYTRNGNQIYAPKEWKQNLPCIALDGELWSGRDQFQSIVSTVRRHEPESQKWKNIQFMVFDAPLVKGNFRARVAHADKAIKVLSKTPAQLVAQQICKGNDHLLKTVEEVVGKNGEGVMIKDPTSLYQQNRSYSLLKVKKFDDAEAKVIGHQRGTGRCSGMCGALLVTEKDGTKFKIGSGFTDLQRRKPPSVGSVVTFKFQGRSKAGIPRFPIFMRIFQEL